LQRHACPNLDVRESAPLSLALMEVLMTVEGSARIDRDDVRAGSAYELARAAERRRIAEAKRFRRVRLAGPLALVFESRDTIRSTLEEALRTERVDDPDRVAAELAAFNAVVPEAGQLAAVLFLDVADPADLSAVAAQLGGVEHAVFIEVEGTRARGIPEAVSPPGESAPAHFLRFSLEPGQRAAILAGSAVAIGCEHPDLTVLVELDGDQRQALASDL
jgi:hypothetical protein